MKRSDRAARKDSIGFNVVDTPKLMLWVVAAMLPGIAVMAVFFGGAILLNAAVATASALVAEAICVALRGQNMRGALLDGSALVTALLIAIALPPATPVFVTVFACVAAIGLGKHAYGGLGQNVFNPAMVGYALALVSFPAAFAVWPLLDGSTGATALDTLKYRDGLTLGEVRTGPAFGRVGGYGWEWVNAAFAAGGVILIAKKIIHWRVPMTFLATLGVMSVLFFDGGSSESHGSPMMHWAMGATMAAAFFVLTDPVSHPSRARAQIIFAIGVGVITFVVRAWGSYPDGIAFAVLLGNAASPYLERRFS